MYRNFVQISISIRSTERLQAKELDSKGRVVNCNGVSDQREPILYFSALECPNWTFAIFRMLSSILVTIVELMILFVSSLGGMRFEFWKFVALEGEFPYGEKIKSCQAAATIVLLRPWPDS